MVISRAKLSVFRPEMAKMLDLSGSKSQVALAMGIAKFGLVGRQYPLPLSKVWLGEKKVRSERGGCHRHGRALDKGGYPGINDRLGGGGGRSKPPSKR